MILCIIKKTSFFITKIIDTMLNKTKVLDLQTKTAEQSRKYMGAYGNCLKKKEVYS